MALTSGYLVLTKNQERLIEINTLIKPARRRFSFLLLFFFSWNLWNGS